MTVKGGYHANFLGFPYSSNPNEIGIYRYGTEILIGLASFRELCGNRVHSLLGGARFNHNQEETIPRLRAILWRQSCAINEWPVRDFCILIITILLRVCWSSGPQEYRHS